MAKEDLRRELPETTLIGVDEQTALELKSFFSPTGDKILSLTDVTPIECWGFPLIRAFGKVFSSKVTDDVVKDILLLRISRLRQGRKEEILITTGLREVGEARKGRAALQSLIGGGLR